MYELRGTANNVIDRLKDYIVEMIEEFKNGYIGDISTYKKMLDVIKMLNNDVGSEDEVDIQVSGDWCYIAVKRDNGEFQCL